MRGGMGPGGPGGHDSPRGHGAPPPPPPHRHGGWGWRRPWYGAGYRSGCGGCLAPFALILVACALLFSCSGMFFW